MKARITIICENTAGAPFGVIGEHGFSCYVETEKGNYLFDTGQGFGIVQNSLILKKDLRQINAVAISHGHYDHTGGLPAVLQIKGQVDVFGHPDMFCKRVWSSGGITRFVGIPYTRSYMEGLGARFRLGTEMVEISSGIYLTGEIPRKTAFEKGDANMTAYNDKDQPIHPDPLKDDLSLVIDSDKGLILVLGCAHAGMVNIINHVLKRLGRDRIYAVVGGTHLGFASDDQFNETLKVIDEYRIERVGVSHCTGQEKAARLRSVLKNRFFFGCVGATLEG